MRPEIKYVDVPPLHVRRDSVATLVVSAVKNSPSGKAAVFTAHEGQNVNTLQTSLLQIFKRNRILVSTKIIDNTVMVWRREIECKK